MSKKPFPPNGGSPLSSPGLKPGASRGHLVNVVSKTLFDELVSHPEMAEADRYIVLTLAARPDGDYSLPTRVVSLIRSESIGEVVMLGDALGEMLRKSIGGDAGRFVLLQLVNAAAEALEGQGISRPQD